MDIKRGTKKVKETAQKVVEKIRKAEEGKITVKSYEREVNFVFHKPDAKRVYLAGDFNNWDTGSLPMRMSKDGTWSKTLKLAPGQYQYGFMADGNWIKDMPCSEIVANPFGTYNCVMRVE
ncbi:MAG: isoamylase early set domain-containing protein [Nitrospirae bacterium]|nr:isoamylase early set domain-containing protein [Nitrospirota bacterium]